MFINFVKQFLSFIFLQILALHSLNWNDLPDSLISSAEMSDDCVTLLLLREFGVRPNTHGVVLPVLRFTSKLF